MLGRTIFIRYEDLCRKPQQIANKLIDFLNLKEHEPMKRFIIKNSYNDVKPTTANTYEPKGTHQIWHLNGENIWEITILLQFSNTVKTQCASWATIKCCVLSLTN